MHPDVCRFVSEAFYEGRLRAGRGLRAAGSTAFGHGPALPAGRARGQPALVARGGGARCAAEIERLLGGDVDGRAGARRGRSRVDDILVVAPYNAQVACLREALPAGVRVGTVDKFQGQQAPVVFFSMATSSGEDVPRNLEFLFSRNRLNVAVSRAKCLAIVVASPKLLDIRCRTVEQMRMANALCALVE